VGPWAGDGQTPDTFGISVEGLSSRMTDLGCRIAGLHKRDDPAQVHSYLQAQEVNVERSAIVEAFGFDVRYNSSDGYWDRL
jgi:hypothetical protein